MCICGSGAYKGKCGDLNKNGPHRLIYFECLVSSSWNCLGRTRGCDFVGGNMSLVVDLEVSEALASLSLSLLPVDKMVSS